MENMTSWVYWLIVLLFVVLPVGILALGAKLVYTTYRFRKNAVLVTGTVVDVKKNIARNHEEIHSPTYHPTFEFTGPNGETLKGKTLTQAAHFNFMRGTEKSILVNLDEPGIVHMPSNTIYYIALGMISIGGAVAYFGITKVLLAG